MAAPARKADPAREAAKPRAVGKEAPRDEHLPGGGTQRVIVPRARPIRMTGTGTGGGAFGPARPTAASLAATQPQRQAARDLALATLKKPQGSAQVARMAAADVGARSEEAARILAERSDLPTLRRLAKHTDASVRVGVARALRYRPKFAHALLGELLTDWSVRVLRAAVQSAADLGSPALVGRLAFLALRHDRSIRSAALLALASHSDVPEARRTLIAALTHASPSVRQDAVTAVGLARAAWALPYLARLAKDPSEALRRRVAQALGRLPPSAGTLRALAGLARDRASEVRKEAAQARTQVLRAKREARKAAPPAGMRRPPASTMGAR